MPSSSYPTGTTGAGDATQTQRLRLIYLPGLDGTGDLFYRQSSGLDGAFDIQSFRFNHLATPTWSDLVSMVVDDHLQGAPAVLCGESFGACLAMAVAARVPDAVAGLILVNSASAFPRATLLNSLSMLLPLLPDTVVRSSSGIGLHWLCDPSLLAPADRNRFKAAIESVRKADTLHRLDLLRQFDADELSLQPVSCPTLVVASQRDRLLPSESEARRLQAILPAAQLKFLPDSGHACLLEREMDLSDLLKTHAGFEKYLASAADLG